MSQSLWGKSVWWTRTGWLLGLAVIFYGGYMTSQIADHLGNCGLQSGLMRPGVAIQLAYDWPTALAIVGTCDARYCPQSQTTKISRKGDQDRLICPDKVAALHRQQTLDYYFIVIYVSFFVYLGLLNILFGGLQLPSTEPGDPLWLRLARRIPSRFISVLGGAATVGLTLAAAYQDWQEDNGIVEALNHLSQAPVSLLLATRDHSYHKWLFIFLAVGCTSPLFAFWPGRDNRDPQSRRSRLMQFLAWLTAFEALTTMVSGIAAFRFGQDQRIESTATSQAVTLLLATVILMGAQFWRYGTWPALNKIADLRAFRWLVTLLPEEDH